MTEPTDETLVHRFVDGDPAAFESLVRRYVHELHQFAARFIGDSLAAEDVIQETLIQLHHVAPSFDAGRRFKPWLFTMAANKARDYLRKRARRRELPFDAPISEKEGGRQYSDLLSVDRPPIDEGLLDDERRALVRDAVGALPDRLREILILAYFHRFPYKDIADVQGIPIGTVKSRLHAAIAEFRVAYEALLGDKSRREQP